MAHFVKLNSQSIVEAVYVIANNEILDEDGNEDEATGVNFCKRHFGSGTYLQTSFNTFENKHYGEDGFEDEGTPFRKNYASVGFIWDAANNGFHEPQPYASWTLDTNSLAWEAPILFPKYDKDYWWDEDAYQEDNTTGWVEIEIQKIM